MKQKIATKPSVTIDHEPEIEPGHHFDSEDAGSPSSTLTMLLQTIALPVVIGLVVYVLVCIAFGWIPQRPPGAEGEGKCRKSSVEIGLQRLTST